MKDFISSSQGLRVSFHPNGTLNNMDAGPVRIGLQEGSPYNRAGVAVWLRKRGENIKICPLTGSESMNAFAIEGTS